MAYDLAIEDVIELGRHRNRGCENARLLNQPGNYLMISTPGLCPVVLKVGEGRELLDRVLSQPDKVRESMRVVFLVMPGVHRYDEDTRKFSEWTVAKSLQIAAAHGLVRTAWTEPHSRRDLPDAEMNRLQPQLEDCLRAVTPALWLGAETLRLCIQRPPHWLPPALQENGNARDIATYGWLRRLFEAGYIFPGDTFRGKDKPYSAVLTEHLLFDNRHGHVGLPRSVLDAEITRTHEALKLSPGTARDGWRTWRKVQRDGTLGPLLLELRDGLPTANAGRRNANRSRRRQRNSAPKLEMVKPVAA